MDNEPKELQRYLNMDNVDGQENDSVKRGSVEDAHSIPFFGISSEFPQEQMSNETEVLNKRGKVIVEILQSEQIFCHSIKLFLHTYFEVFEQDDTAAKREFMSKPSVLGLCQNMKQINQLSTEFLKDFEIHISKVPKAINCMKHNTICYPLKDEELEERPRSGSFWNARSKLENMCCACLGNMMVGSTLKRLAPLLQLYAPYAVNYAGSQSQLNDLNANISFQSLWKECEAKLNEQEFSCSITQSTLQGYLILPIQRVPRYLLLLKQLIKVSKNVNFGIHLASSHRTIYEARDEEMESLFSAQREVTYAANRMDCAIDMSMNTEQIRNLQNKFVGQQVDLMSDIGSNSRQLICEGNLMYRDSMSDKEFKEMHFFLLNDALIASRNIDITKDNTPSSAKFKFKTGIEFTDCFIVGTELDMFSFSENEQQKFCRYICNEQKKEISLRRLSKKLFKTKDTKSSQMVRKNTGFHIELDNCHRHEFYANDENTKDTWVKMLRLVSSKIQYRKERLARKVCNWESNQEVRESKGNDSLNESKKLLFFRDWMERYIALEKDYCNSLKQFNNIYVSKLMQLINGANPQTLMEGRQSLFSTSKKSGLSSSSFFNSSSTIIGVNAEKQKVNSYKAVEMSGLLEPEILAGLQCIHQMLTIHNQLLIQLFDIRKEANEDVPCLKFNPNVTRLVRWFIGMIKVYEAYMTSHYPLRQAIFGSQEIKDIIECCNSKLEGGMKFETIMNKPLFHLKKIEQLYKDWNKCHLASCIDNELNEFKTQMHCLMLSMRRGANQQFHLEWRKGLANSNILPEDAMKNSQWLVREGWLVKRRSNGEKKLFYFWLLQDYLVYGSMSNGFLDMFRSDRQLTSNKSCVLGEIPDFKNIFGSFTYFDEHKGFYNRDATLKRDGSLFKVHRVIPLKSISMIIDENGGKSEQQYIDGGLVDDNEHFSVHYDSGILDLFIPMHNFSCRTGPSPIKIVTPGYGLNPLHRNVKNQAIITKFKVEQNRAVLMDEDIRSFSYRRIRGTIDLKSELKRLWVSDIVQCIDECKER